MEFLFGKHPIIENKMLNQKFNVMISKKSNKANLEKKRPLFFEIGLTIALALALVAFELSPKESTENNLLSLTGTDYIETIDAIITRPEKKENMEKPKAIKIEIVDNSLDIPEPDLNFDLDIDPDEGIDFDPWEPEDEPAEDNGIVFFAEKMPEYRNGGLENFHKYIQEKVKYPQTAIELGLQGTVFVSFVVDKHGEIINLTITRGVDPLLDNEVIAAIEQSDKWKPGMQTGRKVNVAMSMPVTFKLQ
jgi:protein TonB